MLPSGFLNFKSVCVLHVSPRDRDLLQLLDRTPATVALILTQSVGQYSQQPDFHSQFRYGSRTFNVLFEVDRATESIDSFSDQSIRQKLLGYEAYQDMIWQAWKRSGEQGMRPYFKVAFLTTS